MLSIAMTVNAEEEKMNGVDNVNAYDMTINYASLARTLDLTDEQREAVELIHGMFCVDMASVGASSPESRKAMMNNAIVKNLREMHYVLDNGQYRKYLMLLNATVNNRGLND